LPSKAGISINIFANISQEKFGERCGGQRRKCLMEEQFSINQNNHPNNHTPFLSARMDQRRLQRKKTPR